MEYILIRESRKTLVIKILENGKVLVKSPKKCSLDFINKFISSKSSWIEKAIANNLEQSKIIDEYKNLNKIMLFGKSYNVCDDKKHFIIGETYLRYKTPSNKKNIIKKYLNSLANSYIIQRCKYFSDKLGLKYREIKIMSSRVKWGSCNNLKQLNFNFRLIMLPDNLIDYVICHELFHLKELNHSKAFWKLLEGIGFNKASIKKEFKTYNFVLRLL